LGKVLVLSLLALWPLGLLALLFARIRRGRLIPKRFAVGLVAVGALVGFGASEAERFVLGLTELSLVVEQGRIAGPLLALFLFVAPFEEACKVLLVWPLYLRRVLSGARLGILYAASSAAGFAASKSVLWALGQPLDSITIARGLLGAPGHLFFAAAWGYMLGKRGRRRWFSLTWFGAMLLHGVYQHVVFARGPALLVAAVPLLVFMSVLAFLAIKEVAPAESAMVSSPLSLPPLSLDQVTRVMKVADRPVKLRWVIVGAFVTIGVMLSSLALAVYIGHAIGLDFAAADESDLRSGGPLVLLGSGVLGAYPISGYLVARASSTHGVLEPALAALLAIVFVVAVLSVMAPIAVVFGLALAPLAFGLACGGAWLGVR
jgi:RsiW-degrading membrane proteinase PrsW (M82 family)